MAVPTYIADPLTNVVARVTEFGQLVVAPIAYSTAVARFLDTDDAAFNFIEPTQNQRVVITDVIITTDRFIGVNGADISIYAADAPDATTIPEGGSVFDVNLLSNSSLVLTGLNIITDKGVWINAKTSDNNVNMTIGFYRVPID